MKSPILRVDADIDEIMWPNRLLLTSVGLWSFEPHDGPFVEAFARFRLCFTIFIAIFTVIPQCLTIYKYWGDINILTEIGCTVLVMMLMLFKIAYVLTRRDEFRGVYRTMSQLWSLAKNQEERNAIVHFANQSKLCTIVFFYSGLTDVVAFVFAAVQISFRDYVSANGTAYRRTLPLDLWYGFDTQTSPNFELLFVAQVLGLSLTAMSVIGCDSTMMAVIMHFVGQFRLIGLRLRAVGRKIRDGARLDSMSNGKLRLEMALCIHHHQTILKYTLSLGWVELALSFGVMTNKGAGSTPGHGCCLDLRVEELLNPVIFGQLLLAAVEICLTGFAVIEGDGDAASLVKFSSFFSSMFLQLVIWCWPGELAARESGALADVVFYEIPWPALTWREQRNLALIVYRAQKPCRVTALGMQVMCLRKLSEVFNTAISYMALLRSMKDKRTL